MDSRSLTIIAGQFLLAATILAATLITNNTYKTVKLGVGTIHVKGCAEKQIQSDFVYWRGTISASAETQLAAYEKMERDLQIIRNYMRQYDVPDDLLSVEPIYTTIIHKKDAKGRETNYVEGYALVQEISLSSADIPLVTKVSQNITQLMKDGLSIYSYSPQYYYTKIDQLKLDMLGEAAKDAYGRAQNLVNTSNSRVGKVASAQQGVFQITPAYSSSISDYGENDTTSIAKRIRAVVTMTYEIN